LLLTEALAVQDPNWVSDAAAFLEIFDANSFLLR